MLALLVYLPLALVAFPLVVFPVMLLSMARKIPPKSYPEQRDEDLPEIALLIAARNEQASIASKLENSLSLDYPREKLRIIVLANGCTDGTTDVVRSFSDRGVELLEYGEIGKMEAQNRALAELESEIAVFSDANAMYRENALRHLVRPFQDPGVGAVSGRLVYVNTDEPAGATEGASWNVIETKLKLAEARTGGLIGANGSIYAVRRSLYIPLGRAMISDFMEPLLIAARGFRTEYVPEAESYEHAEKDMQGEYSRKVRILRRTAYSLSQYPWLLNPRRSGRLSFLLFGHKVLRWFAPIFLLLALLASTMKLLSGRGNVLDKFLFSVASIVGFLAILGRGLGQEKPIPVLSQAYYAVLLMRASITGLFEAFTKGELSVWDHAR